MEKKHRIGAEVIYHFDVEQHRIPLAQFIDTAEATRDILNNFNDQFFGGKLEYNLHVLPSEEGGLVKNIQITLKIGYQLSAILASLSVFLSQDIGKSIIKDLTGKEPLEWSHETITNLQNLWIDESSTGDTRDKGETSYKTDELTEKLLVNCMAGMPIYFLNQPTNVLFNNNITPNNFRISFEARKKFYEACIKNKEIQGLSFSRTGGFPIKSTDFKKKIIEIPDEVDKDTETKTQELQYEQYEIVEIVVSSPNWNRKGRGWLTQNLITFNIEDDMFWEDVNNKRIKPRVKDRMRVQWIYQGKKSNQHKTIALKVLSYNGGTISEPLSEEAIQEECARKNKLSKAEQDAKSLNNEPSLFSIITNPPNKPPPPE